MLQLRFIFAVALLATGGLGWWLLNGKPTTIAQPTDISADKFDNALRESESTVQSPALRAESAIVTKLRLRVDNLTRSLQSIIAERESVEGELRQAEREVARLERFVEEIEERGEDPVDYADEGLAMFQPAFYAYQEASDKLELAESMEQTATEELAVAERELALALTGQGKE
ncbi:MAG: hypothetical protein ACR2PS_15970 [Pseudomonadales bacterium]